MASRVLLVRTVLVLAALVAVGRTQVLDQQIVSFTKIDTCVESPLGREEAVDLSGDDEQQQLDTDRMPRIDACSGKNSSVIVLGLRIQPGAIQGGQEFRFTMSDTVPNAAGDYSDPSMGDAENGEEDVRVCAGVDLGENCEILPQAIVVSVAATEIFAYYDLVPLRQIPYAYRNRFMIVDDDDLSDTLCNKELPPDCPKHVAPTRGQSYTVSRPCDGQDLFTTYFGDLDETIFTASEGQTREPVCPELGSGGYRTDEWQYYYTPPQSALTPESGNCDIAVFGPTLGDTGTDPYVLEALEYGPMCTVFNVEPRARAAVHLNVSVRIGSTDHWFLMGTETSGVIGGVPGVMFAQINGVNSLTGLYGPYMPGQYVVCNTCPEGTGAGECVEGFMDDLAGGPRYRSSSRELKTLFNPYREYGLSSLAVDKIRRCPLPAAACRQVFGGEPPDAFAYFVQDYKQVENTAMCNANGIGGNPYSDPTVRRYVATTLAQCTSKNQGSSSHNKQLDICNAFNACLPGHEQPLNSPSGTFNKNFVPTPCKVSRTFGETLAVMDPEDFQPNVQHVEMDRNINAPQYFHRGSRVYRDIYGGSVSSLSLTLYVVADELTSVVSLAPGKFDSSGMSCGGTNGGAGSVGFRVRNTGTVVGTYVVDMGFYLPPENPVGTLTVDQQTALPTERRGALADADTVVRVSGLQVSPGLFKDGYVTYEYTGELGHQLNVTMVLRLESASGSQQLDTRDVSCVNVLGTSDSNALFNPDSPFNEYAGGVNCYWWKWWGGCLHNWGATEIMIYVIIVFLLLLNITMFVMVCIWTSSSTSHGREALELARRTVKDKERLYGQR